MIFTATLRSPSGFWERSLNEVKRITRIALSAEGVRPPTAPMCLIDFTSPHAVDECKIMSDDDFGGASRAKLEFVPRENSTTSPSNITEELVKLTRESVKKNSYLDPYMMDRFNQVDDHAAFAKFSGEISLKIPERQDSRDVMRSGYAGWRTRDHKLNLFGRFVWNLDAFESIALRVRSDGRDYMVNIQPGAPDAVLDTDILQHRLSVPNDGLWHTVKISLSSMVRTNFGMVIEPPAPLPPLRHRLRSVGISVVDRIPGPFELCIRRIWATDPWFGDYERFPSLSKLGPVIKNLKTNISHSKE